MHNLFYLIFCFLTSFLLIKFLIPFLKNYKLVDIPNHRSSHIKEKINGGGISFIFTTLFFSFLQGNYELFVLLPIAITGFIDDKFKISSIFRFSVQAGTVFIILYLSGINSYLLIDNFSLLNSLIFGFFIFFGIGLINCINFMDGIDGLIGISVIPSLLLVSSFYEPALLLLGGLLGFLIWNWHPSKIFMGDTGSLFIGSFLCYSIFNPPTLEIGIAVCLLLSPLILDSGLTLVKRLLNYENIFKAHKSHLYQRLEQSGFKHSEVSLIYFFSSLFLYFIFKFTNIFGLIFGNLIIFTFGFYLNFKFTKKKV